MDLPKTENVLTFLAYAASGVGVVAIAMATLGLGYHIAIQVPYFVSEVLALDIMTQALWALALLAVAAVFVVGVWAKNRVSAHRAGRKS